MAGREGSTGSIVQLNWKQKKNTEGDVIQENPVYQRIPNYADSNPVEEIDLQTLSPRVFSREFVHQNRPCVIRGGGKHWPAVTRWASLDYLKDKFGHQEVNVNTRGIKPQTVNMLTLSMERHRQALEYKRCFVSTAKMKFRDFVDKAEHAPAEELPEFFCMYSQAFRPQNPFANLAEDCGSFAFLPRPRNSRLCLYPFRSVFMYRRGITDWHFHPTAGAILTQIRGSKEVVLLPPDNSTWERFLPLLKNEIHVCNADLGKYPEFAKVRPVRAHLLSGDCLYIPTHWWHLVATDAPHFGMSVPTWWDSPLHIQADISRKIARHSIRMMTDSRSLAFKLAYLSLLTGSALSAPLVRLFYGTAAAKG